ncbi:MAG: AMP-dependent synthetase [Microbacterium sp. SCN 70-27]|uniref:AMP-binding protein n=1 Tax=unclassified Microbacterium TaxID=2609290 RepID=UPI00086889E3|nr:MULTISPECIES: AMP-binding protein [unclassified Microbacterium]MBN9224325.1 AMP-binding protein [Microbacterium sp.]ODT28768.1 MAG: AMP-dependent synthetase [Microbacterium sp. SCN 70-27]
MASTPAGDAFRRARDLLLTHRDDPAAARAAFEWPDVGDHFNWAVDWFDQIADGNDAVALRVVEEDGSEASRTFAQLRDRSNQVANWFASIGIRRGDPVMLMVDNRVELWETMLAVMKAGAVILPTSIVLGPAELAERIDRAGVRAVVADTTDAAKFDDLDPDLVRVIIGGERAGWHPFTDADTASTAAPGVVVDSGDASIVYFTSGTTSRPKMVEHTHLSYPVGHLSTMYWIGVQPGDVHMTISAPGWGKHAWSLFFAPWIAEASVFVYNYRRFDAAALAEQLDRADVNTFCAPPTVWRMLIQADLEKRPRALRELLSAGEPLNPEVIATMRRWWGLEIRDGYGQTELTAVIGNTPGVPVKPGSMGKALPGVEIVLLDPITGEPADEGEICLPTDPVRPLNLMAGYLGEPERTGRAIHDGHFHTSDVAVRDADGFLTFIGRTDDVFKASDFKVSPFEVESILLEHPAVAEAGVVGAPDAVRLNVVKAYVALVPGATADAETAHSILAHARRSMPPYMRVRRVEFAELPKTISGKIRRVELREREQELAEARIETEFRESDFPALKSGN